MRQATVQQLRSEPEGGRTVGEVVRADPDWVVMASTRRGRSWLWRRFGDAAPVDHLCPGDFIQNMQLPWGLEPRWRQRCGAPQA